MASSCASLVKPQGCGTPSDPIWSVIRVMFETLLSLHSQQDHGTWFLSSLLLLQMTSQNRQVSSVICNFCVRVQDCGRDVNRKLIVGLLDLQ